MIYSTHGEFPPAPVPFTPPTVTPPVVAAPPVYVPPPSFPDAPNLPSKPVVDDGSTLTALLQASYSEFQVAAPHTDAVKIEQVNTMDTALIDQRGGV